MSSMDAGILCIVSSPMDTRDKKSSTPLVDSGDLSKALKYATNLLFLPKIAAIVGTCVRAQPMSTPQSHTTPPPQTIDKVNTHSRQGEQGMGGGGGCNLGWSTADRILVSFRIVGVC